jgi:hypothetical protein
MPPSNLQETRSGDSQRQSQLGEIVADNNELERSIQQQVVLQEDGVKILKAMSDMKAEHEKIKKDATVKIAEVGAKAEKAAAAASLVEEGAARRIAALENEVYRLQAALAEQSTSQSAKAAAVEDHLNEVANGYKRDLAAAEEQADQKIDSLRSGLNLANEAHNVLAAQVAAVTPAYVDLDAAKASLQAALHETVRLAVDAALDERRLLKQSESTANYVGSDSRNSMVSVLRDLYESRTEGVDWLLEINGARVEESSQSFIHVPSLLGAVRWLFPGQQVLAPSTFFLVRTTVYSLFWLLFRSPGRSSHGSASRYGRSCSCGGSSRDRTRAMLGDGGKCWDGKSEADSSD